MLCTAFQESNRGAYFSCRKNGRKLSEFNALSGESLEITSTVPSSAGLPSKNETFFIYYFVYDLWFAGAANFSLHNLLLLRLLFYRERSSSLRLDSFRAPKARFTDKGSNDPGSNDTGSNDKESKNATKGQFFFKFWRLVFFYYYLGLG